MKLEASALLAVLLFLSCKKEEKGTPLLLADPAIPALEFTNVPGVEATLEAAYVSSIKREPLGSYTFFEGIARAEFNNNLGQPASAKEVICEGYVLERDLNIYRSATPHDYGLDFGSSVSWEVTGQGSVPAFDEEIQHKVPEIGDINIGDSLNSRDTVWLKIDLDSPFTILGTVDSVQFSITGNASSYNFAVLSPADSVAISPKQLQGCGSGKCYIKAEAIHITKKSYQGYTVAFINKGMFYKPVWLY